MVPIRYIRYADFFIAKQIILLYVYVCLIFLKIIISNTFVNIFYTERKKSLLWNPLKRFLKHKQDSFKTKLVYTKNTQGRI